MLSFRQVGIQARAGMNIEIYLQIFANIRSFGDSFLLTSFLVFMHILLKFYLSKPT